MGEEGVRASRILNLSIVQVITKERVGFLFFAFDEEC